MSVHANARPRSLYGSRAAIASGHHLATQAAGDVLRSGGTLADALIAASAVLAVTLPHACSLGGCGMLLYFDAASGQVLGLNGSGRAPLQAQPAHFADGMPQRGVRAAVVPTLVRLWARLHERFGRQSWAQLLAPAITLAGEGVAVPEELARNLRQNPAVNSGAGSLRQQPGFDALFMPQGRVLAAGDTLAQPQLARVLKTVAQQGEAGFFEGWVADALLAFSQRHGGFFSREDFARAQADWVQPWSCRLGQTVAYAMPPNSVGALMLRQLEVWHAAGRAGEDSTGTAADIENAVAVIRQGQRCIGDAGRTPITPEHIGLGSGALSLDSPVPHGVHPAKGDTAGFVAMDENGNALAMLQSVFQPFGSGAVDGGDAGTTGILLNNRMFDFSAESGQANSVGAGLRPAHTLNPWLTMLNGQPHMTGVSPGGVSQTTTGFQLVRRAQSGTDTLGQIVSAPRWSLSRSGEILLEPGMPAELAQLLRARGFVVVENSAHEFYFGSAKLLRRNPQGWLEAAADARRQATALAW